MRLLVRNSALAIFLASYLGASGVIAQTMPPARRSETPQPAATEPVQQTEEKTPSAKNIAGQKQAPKAKSIKAKIFLIDINSASEQMLGDLPGVGKAYAASIIKGRPYKGKDELLQKKIIPQAVYEKIKAKIIAKQAIAHPPVLSKKGAEL